MEVIAVVGYYYEMWVLLCRNYRQSLIRDQELPRKIEKNNLTKKEKKKLEKEEKKRKKEERGKQMGQSMFYALGKMY